MTKTFREMFAPGRVVSNLGSLKFQTSIFREEQRTPHWEMDKALSMYERRPQVNSGVNQFVSFVIGEKLYATSEDKRSQEFLQKWTEQRPRLKRELRKFCLSTVVGGNGYLEPSYISTKNGINIIDNLFTIPDSSRVYYNLDHNKTINEYWIYEVPIEVKVFPWQGIDIRPKFWRINYVRGSILFQKMVYGIPIHKDKILHLPIGLSRDNIYGRGFLASAIDDNDVLMEILKNMAIISRTRALNLKILTIGTEQDKATPEDIDRLDGELKTRREEQHIIVNKPIKEIDLAHQGKYDTMKETIDFLRRDIASGLVPSYLTPWADEINRSTATQIKIPFQLELNSIKEDILLFVNEVICDSLRKAYPWLAKDARIEFKQVDLTAIDEKMQFAEAMFRNNAITLNEYRMAAGYDRTIGGDQWGTDLPLPVANIRRFGQDASTGAEPKKEIPTKVNLANSFTENLEDPIKEFYEAAIDTDKLLKDQGIATEIKTLNKGDKNEVTSFLYDAVDKNMKLKIDAKEFRQMLSKEIQTYHKGKPEYEHYILERIARTEWANLRELSKLLRWKKEGHKKVIHITHISPNSGKKDIEFNGREFKIEHLLEHREDRVPLHSNCRCHYSLLE